MGQSNSFSVSKTFFSGEIHFGIWGVVSKGVGAINTVIVLSALTVYQYGVFQLLLALYAILSTGIHLAGSTASNDITRYIGESNEGKAKKLFIEYNLVRGGIAILLWICFFFAAEFILSPWYKEDFIAFFKILSFLFLIDAVISAQKTIIKARLNFKAVAQRSTYQKIIQCFVLLFFLMSAHIGIAEVLYSIVIGSFVSSLTLIPPMLKSMHIWRTTTSFKESLLRPMLALYGKWEVLKQLFSRTVNNIHPILIKIFISTEAVAFYSIAVQVSDALGTLLSSQTLSSIIPRIIKDHSRSQRIFHFGIKFFFLVGLIFSIVTAIAGPLILYLFFPKYIPSIEYILALSFVLPFATTSMLIDIFLTAYRRQRFLLMTSAVRNITTIALLLALLPLVGLWGAIAAKYAVVIGICIFGFYYLQTRIPRMNFRFIDFFTFNDIDREYGLFLWKQLKAIFQKKISTFIK